MMSHFAVLISPRLNGGLIATFIFEAPFTALHLALILFIYLQSHLHMSQSEMHNFFIFSSRLVVFSCVIANAAQNHVDH